MVWAILFVTADKTRESRGECRDEEEFVYGCRNYSLCAKRLSAGVKQESFISQSHVKIYSNTFANTLCLVV